MSVDPKTTRIVRSWLDEGVTQLPDRVLDAVLDQVPATPQRRATWWPVRRYQSMNSMLKFGLAAAVVAVIAIVGYQLLPGSNRGSGGPAVTPAPTVTPQPSPTDTPQPTPTPEGLLPEGPYVLSWPDGPAVTVTIPAPGWEGDSSGGVLVRNNGGDPPDGAAIIGPFFGELYVYGDPCQWSTTMPDTPATTVDEAVTALTAQASRDASAPVDITVDGYAGKSITLHVPDDAVFSDCDDDRFASWAGGGDDPSTGPSRYHQGPGQIDELWILDVGGQLIVMDAMYGAETSAEHLAELHAILESMTFEE